MFGWKASRVKVKVASTTSAEMIALKDSLKQVWLFVNAFQKVFGYKPEIEFVIDSMPLRDLLVNGWYKSEPAMQGMLDYCIEQLRALNAKVFYINTSSMLADGLTKFIKE